jgi:tetratricopeptide (TPR) repeat protein
MKNYLPFLITIVNVFSFNGFAQASKFSLDDKRMVSRQIMLHTLSEVTPTTESVVKSYYVEEKINMNFGSSITTYDVPELSQVRTNDLGPNNSRVVTLRYGIATKLKDNKSKILAKNLNYPMKVDINSAVVDNSKKNDTYATIDVLKANQIVANQGSKFDNLALNKIRILNPISAEVKQLPNYPTETVKEALETKLEPTNLNVTDDSKKHDNYIYIDILKTYERVLEKGYKSIDMFQKIGNAYYFNNELEKAARWYTELFAMTSNLEPVYYYRYAQSLKAIGQNEKADSMMGKYVLKNQQNDSAKILLKNNHHEK